MDRILVSPKWDQAGTSLRHTWAGLVNIDQFRWMIRRDVQDQLKMAHDEIGARHVRAVGMFDDEMRVIGVDPARWRDKANKYTTNFQIVDYVFDSLLDRGIRPMFTTSFMPGQLAIGDRTVFTTKSRISPPKDSAAWAKLVTESVQHAVDRYGLAEVKQWYFEVWNEPNLRNGFFEGTQQDFFELWATTYRAIKSVDASLRVGGPSTARAEWVSDLLDFGQQNGCSPDYIITHIYNNDSESSPLSPFDGPQEDRASKSAHFAVGVIRGVRKLLDDHGYKGEVHWNEWGRSWHPHYPDRETAAEAAFICKTMSEASQLADYFAYWNLSDIYDQVGYGNSAFHGNYGMLSLQSLRKPNYFAHQLLMKLGDRRHDVSIESTQANAGAMATAGDSNQVVLCWIGDAGAASGQSRLPWSVVLPKLPTDRHKSVTLYRLGQNENNILADWQAMGAPNYLSREQTRALQATNTLKPADKNAVKVTQDAGRTIASFDMDDPGVALLTIG